MRELLSYGYVSYTGQKWADCQVDSYNAIQSTINKFLESRRAVPDYLLIGSHNLFVCFSAKS